MDLDYQWFKRKIKEITGIDLDSYRPEQTKRLINKAMEEAGVSSYVKFIKILRETPSKVQDFKDSITINVSHLFRDKKRWDELNKHLTILIKEKVKTHSGGGGGKPDVVIWSAGCSIGAEPYTLSIMMEELRRDKDFPSFSRSILCTDLDNTILQRAREGIFVDAHMKEVDDRLLLHYFDKIQKPEQMWAQRHESSVFYRVKPALKEHMDFRLHNLLESRWEKGFDLITCRNVIIYFTPDAKKQVFRKFSESLNEGGILFIGATETMFSPKELGFEAIAPGTYKKVQSN